MCFDQEDAQLVAAFIQGTTRIRVCHTQIRNDCGLVIRVSFPDSSARRRIDRLQIRLTSDLHHQALVILTQPTPLGVWAEPDVLEPTVELNGRLTDERIWDRCASNVPHGKNAALVTRARVVRHKLECNSIQPVRKPELTKLCKLPGRFSVRL